MTLGAWVLALVIAASAGAGQATTVGSAAPDFELEDVAGNTVRLSDHAGKVRVLEWVNPDCPFVVRHYKAGTMKGLASQFADEDVVWLTVNSTHYMDAAANAAFAKKHGLEQTVLVDADGTVGRSYGAKTTPHMFVIDRDGTIAYAGAIDDDPRGSKGEAAVNYVEQALGELIAGKTVSVSETKPYGCSVKYAK